MNIGLPVRTALAMLPPVPTGLIGRTEMPAVLRDALQESQPTSVWVISGQCP